VEASAFCPGKDDSRDAGLGGEAGEALPVAAGRSSGEPSARFRINLSPAL